MGKGNVFTCVCLATRGVVSHLTITGHMTRGSASRGHLHPRGFCIQGRLHPRVVGQIPPNEIYGILRDSVNKWAVCILLECFLVTVRKRSCGKVKFSQPCDKNSVHRGEVYIPRADTPLSLDRHSPLGRHPLIRRLLQRTVRILLECFLVTSGFCLQISLFSGCGFLCV